MTVALLYDADCGLCRVCVAVALSWDRRGALRPTAIQSAEGQRLLAELTPAERLASWHLVEPDGRLSSAGAAFPPLLRLLPGGGPLAWLAARFKTAADRGYRAVADHRTALGPLFPAATRRWGDRVIARRGSSQPTALSAERSTMPDRLPAPEGPQLEERSALPTAASDDRGQAPGASGR